MDTHRAYSTITRIKTIKNIHLHNFRKSHRAYSTITRIKTIVRVNIALPFFGSQSIFHYNKD